MNPFFADVINIPMVLAVGIVVLVPLIAFEVFVEALVLKGAWRLPYGQLCTFTLFANCWSLLAGIPTKILNAFLYALLFPEDIPGFFERYPFAITIGIEASDLDNCSVVPEGHPTIARRFNAGNVVQCV